MLHQLNSRPELLFAFLYTDYPHRQPPPPICNPAAEAKPKTSYYFGLHVQSAAFLPHPLHLPFSIGLPHFLQGEQPQLWHMVYPFPRP